MRACGEVWTLQGAGTANVKAKIIYSKDALCETIPLVGKEAPAFMRLCTGKQPPSVLHEAMTHSAYFSGLLARSFDLLPRPTGPDCNIAPLRVLPDAKLVFESSHEGSGGASTIVCSQWGGQEKSGDLLFQMRDDDPSKLMHVYVMVSICMFIYGIFSVSHGTGV